MWPSSKENEINEEKEGSAIPWLSKSNQNDLENKSR